MNKKTFDVCSLVDEVVEEVQATVNAPGKKHKIIVKGIEQKQVKADRYRIKQVLSNFLTNAIKYSPDADKVIVEVKEEDNKLTVAVQDFGLGIPKENHSKVFNKFYRVHETEKPDDDFTSLGLGLYISAEIIRHHRGEIWAESKEGQGSTFYFSIPLE